MMYAVVRLRGNVGIDDKTEDTMEMLDLKNKFNCVLIPENKSYEGMLEKAQKVITWGKINEETLSKLLKKRGYVKNNGRLSENLEEMGYDSIGDLIDELKGDSKVKDLGIKVPFRLNSPSKGFKSNLKNLYPQGELGNRKENINDLLKRMI
ncbi:MAG: 50S ribosomal protein L30 [Candidatus Aenigmatarchaeota archaeon]